MRLRLPADPLCRPTSVRSVSLTAMGDFPLRDPWITSFDPAAGPILTDPLPAETEEVAVRALGEPGWSGEGLWLRRAGAAELLLLPPGRSCRLSDPLGGAVREGAALLALPEGGLLVIGGFEAGLATREIFELAPGQSGLGLSDRATVVRRGAASVTLLGGRRALLAGGAGTEDGVADDTFEALDLELGADAAQVAGALSVARRDHSALALSETRVLLVGGRTAAGGEALASLEEVDLEEGASPLPALLTRPRLAPLLLLDGEGRVVVAGGRDASGAPLAGVDRLSADRSTAREVARSPVAGPVVALPGDRLAFVGGADRLEVGLVLLGSAPVATERVTFDLAALREPVPLALADGRLLVEGRGLLDGRPHAYLLDPGIPSGEELASAATPDRLLELADGALAELASGGSALRRESLRSAFESLPSQLFFGLEEDRLRLLAQDAPSRWSPAGTALRAEVEGARIDLPLLLYADFSLTLDADPGVELRLRGEERGEGGESAVLLEEGRVSLGGCEARWAPGAPVSLLRLGDRLTLSAGGPSVECELRRRDRLGLAFLARAGATLRSLILARRR